MAQTEWRPVGRIDRSRVNEARLQVHYAAQWLARAARAYVPARPDDGHTNLGWDETFGGLTMHAMPDGSRLALQFAALSLVLTEVGCEKTFALDGRTDRDVRAWLGPLMRAKGYDAALLDAPSPYEMPAHAIAQGAAYAGGALHDALAELANWYGNANDTLGATETSLNGRGFNAPPVRCWPHHFDLDTLVVFPSKGPDDYRSLGLGFSPGDEYYDEPYLYVSVYPAPAEAALPRLPPVGHWHTHEFTAAVATASRIAAAKNPKADTMGFLQVAVEAAIKALD